MAKAAGLEKVMAVVKNGAKASVSATDYSLPMLHDMAKAAGLSANPGSALVIRNAGEFDVPTIVQLIQSSKGRIEFEF